MWNTFLSNGKEAVKLPEDAALEKDLEKSGTFAPKLMLGLLKKETITASTVYIQLKLWHGFFYEQTFESPRYNEGGAKRY